MKKQIKFFAGVDVQIKRGCCYYIIDEKKKFIESGWVKENVAGSLREVFIRVTKNNPNKIAIGIDAPRMPMNKMRQRNFERKTNSWIDRKVSKNGRECEVIIKSFNLGNPQWTMKLKDSPDWMKLGFSIYDALEDFPFVYEVFPSASYRMLEKENVKYELCLNNFSSGIKDMLDASVAAITVYEFIKGKGCEVGGEDGLGTIVLPRRIDDWKKD
jgi:predicted nuclease with RNAse H fold